MANITLGGSVGTAGTYILGTATITNIDATYTLSVAEYTNQYINVIGALTAQQNIQAPLTNGFIFLVSNNTTGGKSIQFIGATGTGVVIANGARTWVSCDGTNYNSVAGSATSFTAGGDLSGSGTSQSVIKINGNAVSAQTLGASQDGYVLTYTQADGYYKAKPTAIQFVASGDLSGTPTVQVVEKINGNAVSSSANGATQDGYVLTWVNGSAQYQSKIIPTQTATGAASGDLSGTYPSPTVAKVNGSTIPAGGALTTGNTLYVSGVGALSYGALNLAGGSNYISGSLPKGNQAVQDMVGDVSGNTGASVVDKIKGKTLSSTLSSVGSAQDGYVLTWVYGSTDWECIKIPVQTATGAASGDLSGFYPNPTVVSINSATVPAAGSLITGNGLYVSGTSALSYGALNLAGGSNYVTGVLPKANQGVQDMVGDVSGNTGASVVDKLKGKALGSTIGTIGATQDGYVITWVQGSLEFQPKPTLTAGTASGDLSGSYPSPTVAKINGSTVPAGGALTTGNTLYVSGSGALSYGALNLAGGANYVTGILPSGNQSAQSMGGDVTGTTAASTVAKINGISVSATTAANKMVVATSASVSVWSQIFDGYVASNAAIAVSKLAAGSSAQMLLSNATPTPTWTTISGDMTIGATGTTTVAKINGSTVPAGGALTTGNILYVSGAGALSYGALNLAGGANYVTGTLPSANQVAQTMVGDVIGTTSANLVGYKKSFLLGGM